MTPFPFTTSSAGIDAAYAAISQYGDMSAHHFDAGVPWDEAAVDAWPYNANLMADWLGRKARSVVGQQIFLQVTPLNAGRSGLALAWNAAGQNQALTSPWSTVGLNDPQVRAAYLNYLKRAIAFFAPQYVSIGIEVNLLMANNKSAWPAYVELQTATYQALKAAFPRLQIVASMTATDLLGYTSSNQSDQAQALTDVLAASDYLCLSSYVYISQYLTASIPANAFDRLAALTTKPIAICETGYPSVSFSTVGPPALSFQTDPGQQQAYLKLLFAAADKYAFKFIVNWLARDYDATLGTSDTALLFRYTGLLDANGQPKPAMTVWSTNLARTHR